jgi:prepilin-type N-terminal cleavage/methylation domain-containing protein/prepilin-type processing-associated H-X9-DG protein
MRTNCNKKENKAFTLVELLVVISVIAMLLAILLPSLSKARDSAKAIVCGNNMRQLGMAWRFYAQDNEDWFPVGLYWTYAYAWWKDEYGIPKYLPTKTRWGNTKTDNVPTEDGVYKGWYCSAHAEEAIKENMKHTSSYGIAVGYQFNYNLGFQRQAKNSSIPTPGNVPLLFDFWIKNAPKSSGGGNLYLGNYCSYPSNDAANPFPERSNNDERAWYFTDGIRDVHGRNIGTNFLFVDGHVKRIAPMKTQVDYGKAFRWTVPNYAWRVPPAPASRTNVAD